MAAIRGVLMLLATGVVVAAEGVNAKDLEAMQGRWAGERLVRDGQPLEDDDAQSMFRTVTGNAYTVFRFRKKVSSGTFTLDATASPRQIDIVPAGASKGVVIRGVYRLEGDRLTMCYAPPKQERPRDFTARAGSGHTLAVWVREKK